MVITLLMVDQAPSIMLMFSMLLDSSDQAASSFATNDLVPDSTANRK